MMNFPGLLHLARALQQHATFGVMWIAVVSALQLFAAGYLTPEVR